MATAQDYLSNDKWVRRIEDYFDEIDQNKNGFVTREETFTSIVTRLEEVVGDRPQALLKARETMEEYMDAMGLVKGLKADKTKYKELEAAFAVAEAKRFANGELTYTEKIDYAIFDAIDKNENGYLSFEEYKVLIEFASMGGEETARAAFDLLDKDKSGRLDKKEFAIADVKFWYKLDENDTDGMYGPAIH